jgi:O-methyltransferase involved in polyketide biosynthesis/GNAT superfamily N-acetyltransferase
MLKIASPVAKTAFDAVQAKRSALAVGYNPLVVAKEDVYKDFLQRLTCDLKVKRQTPLVNAGYAARVIAVSHVINSFVTFHSWKKKTAQIQIVFLGCGVDVIGLWAGLLDTTRIRIIEVDTDEVCAVKKETLVRQELVHPPSMESVDDDEITTGVFKGTIRKGKEPTSGASPNYTLVPVDLREISQLEKFLYSSIIDTSLPTLVVSELVLSYLSQAETDQLLAWCASRLCVAPESAMVALEPLGASPSHQGNVISVTEGYRLAYCQQFGAKMEKGTSNNFVGDKDNRKAAFYPMGVTCASVTQLLQHAGFASSHASNLGTATANALRPISFVFQTPEIFDEHAALSLHLQSYTVACGFSSQSEYLLQRLVCPGSFPSEPQPVVVQESSTETTIIVTVIESMDEEPVRKLFLETYEPFFEEYPPVRKMAKAALKSDLDSARNNGKDDCASSIAAHYKTLGGCFVVAIQYNQGGTRQVVGCVGIRLQDNDVNTMEIFRLLVNANQRGKGIGKRLMKTVEDFAVSQKCTKLVATTITILAEANKLYESLSFEKEREWPLGNLVLRSFFKDLKQNCVS